MMNRLVHLIVLAAVVPLSAHAHDGHSHAPSPQTQKRIVQLNTQPSRFQLVAQRNPAKEPSDTKQPDLANMFAPFADTVKVRSDQNFLYVESNGMPNHPMMIGITAWQQQVPLPKSYSGNNAWQIPINPTPAKKPMSAKTHFFRGAIALAANGVPIFNPIKNDGKTDTLLAGELDQWGGHCGRGDDYHYHIAPVHLEEIVGAGNPIGAALDGYPIYGYNDADGKPPQNLDWLNGHKDADGNYHYHATKKYPYLNGGFFGEVVELNGQVDPQPRSEGIRPAARPLRGAKITGFENPKPNSYVVRYDVNGDKRTVEYTVANDGSVTFNFVSQNSTTSETYSAPHTRSGGEDDRRNADRPREQNRPPLGEKAFNDRGSLRRGRGGDSLFRVLDSNGDGQIDKTELRNAATSLGILDRNNDGQITDEEMRGRGSRRGPQTASPQGTRAGGQATSDPRQPWILVHADEIDLNKDKIISRDEIIGEATKAFAGYDSNKDDQLSESELVARGNSRSAMGGFLKGHSKELDRDGDGILTQAEAIGNAERMFAKMDLNGDGLVSPDEMEASRRK